MTVLVTGGTGMLGSAVVRGLNRSGYDVVAADLLPQLYFLRGRGVREEDVDVVALDIADEQALNKLLSERDFSAVVHLAASVPPGCNNDPVAGTKANCLGAALLLEGCRRRGITRVIMASSIAMYGSDPATRQVTDSVADQYEEGEQPFSPGSVIYGAGKAYLEALGAHYARSYGMELAGLRCAFIASAGRPSRPPLGAVTGEMIDAPACGRAVRVPYGNSTLPWIYVEDVVAQFLTLLKADSALLRRGPFFNTGAITCTIRDIIDTVLTLIPDAQLEVGDQSDDLVLGNPKTYSDSLFVDTFGHSRKFQLLDGVRAQIDEARKWNDLTRSV
jgi:nucleoside-diphosphate-sugar epimerase